MTLIELLDNLNDMEDDLTIYATADPEWSELSEAVVCPDADEGSIPPEAQGKKYLLEVFLAKAVVDVWQKWRDGRKPSAHEKFEAIVFYAKNDAYLPI